MTQQWVTVLGSTGSIGQSTLDVISRHPDRYSVYALTANRQVDTLFVQCLEHSPKFAVMVDEESAAALAERLSDKGSDIQVLSGPEALVKVSEAGEVHQVMAAIVGAAGLLPTLAAAKAGKRVLLANKEALVMSGKLFMDTVKENGAQLLPIDSEHNAIFQSLPSDYEQKGFATSGVRKILLTASGGPFRGQSSEQLQSITPAQAVKHPNWSMGQKISVDSSTLMNKGLELIEACWLFDVTPDQVEVVVHPESVVHSMVQYNDGSVISQMGNPDMRTPIAYGMAWPERIESGVNSLDFFALKQLNFEAPDHDVFPALRLAAEAFELGGTAPAVLNAANEIAVEAFLQEQIGFDAIPSLIQQTLKAHKVQPADTLDTVLQADHWARQFCKELMN